MKVLAFTDIHNNLSIIKVVTKEALDKKPDLIICCGDITLFGDNLDRVLKKINEISLPCLIIPGNHEDGSKLNLEIKKYKNLINLHHNIYEFNDFIFVGSGGGWFNDKTPEFDKYVKIISKQIEGKKIILLTHQPPYNNKLDNLDYFGHVGNKTYRKFIDEFNPVLSLSGHLHENFGKTDKIGKTIVINPGPLGKTIEV